MRKRANFDTYWDDGWPELKWLERYFLTLAGRRQLFAGDNDNWGLTLEGVEGTEHLPPYRGRIDIDLTILVHPDLGVLLCYHRSGGGSSESHYSKGDLRRLREWIKTFHGDRMPVGFFVPFETAWKAVKEFVERDAALPTSIEWVAGKDIPPGTFPAP
ncbi:MAG: hypothetical protein QOF19_278 [Alphaproteobacteria bacterium]|jgi:hypothetical protein|nr:hypothetical protein [Alphaproteobacteria bacterium]